jgi:hypothetical protein
MKPVTFEGQNTVLGKGQPEYLELPALKCFDDAGTVWSCWELDDFDLEDLIRTRKLWVGQLTFNRAFAPQMVTASVPVEVSVAMLKAMRSSNET